MSDSRISKAGELLLRRHAGVFLPERRKDEACRQLAGLVERRFPGALHSARGEEGLKGLCDLLVELQLDDYEARELVNAIVPLPERKTKGALWPIRILFLSARPDTTSELRVDREHKEIQEALRQATHRDKFVLHTELAVQVGDLQRHLLDYEPDIVHFSGHGRDGAIVLERKDGSAWQVCGEELAKLFGIIEGIRCVVLNACMTSPKAAPISRTAGAVITWPDKVLDSDAILFARHFYQALAYGCTIQKAFELGSQQLKIEAGWRGGTQRELDCVVSFLRASLPELLGDSSVCFASTGRG